MKKRSNAKTSYRNKPSSRSPIRKRELVDKSGAFQRRSSKSSWLNVRDKPSTDDKESLGVQGVTLPQHLKRDEAFYGIKSLGACVDKNVSTGTSILDEGKKDAQSGAGTKQNVVVEEKPLLVRTIRDERWIKNLFEEPAARVEELLTEENILNKDTDKATGLSYMEPYSNQVKAPVTPHWNMARSNDCDLNTEDWSVSKKPCKWDGDLSVLAGAVSENSSAISDMVFRIYAFVEILKSKDLWDPGVFGCRSNFNACW